MNIAIISSSLDPQSRSRLLAHACRDWVERRGWRPALLDLRDYPLPDFDNDRIFADANFLALKGAIQAADSIVIVSSVYNWGLSSTLKKVIESTGSHSPSTGLISAWFDKIVTFVCAGGLSYSYMAYTSAAAGLMLDFKCIINPHIVYAVGADFGGDAIGNPAIVARIDKVMGIMAELTERLAGRSYASTWEV